LFVINYLQLKGCFLKDLKEHYANYYNIHKEKEKSVGIKGYSNFTLDGAIVGGKEYMEGWREYMDKWIDGRMDGWREG